MAEAAALAIFAPLSIQTRGSLLAMSVDIDVFTTAWTCLWRWPNRAFVRRR